MRLPKNSERSRIHLLVDWQMKTDHYIFAGYLLHQSLCDTKVGQRREILLYNIGDNPTRAFAVNQQEVAKDLLR